MSYLQQLISNSVLITALIGWFAAQVLKMILVWDKKKFDFKRIIGVCPKSSFRRFSVFEKSAFITDSTNLLSIAAC